MANKFRVSTSDKKTFDSGREIADTRGNDSIKSKVGFIREAFPLRSKNDVALVLQSCDYNIEAAMGCFARGEADDILKEWSVQQGKKWKNGSSKKKRNKKKQSESKPFESNSLQEANLPTLEKKSEEEELNGALATETSTAAVAELEEPAQCLEQHSPVETLKEELLSSSASSVSIPEATVVDNVSTTVDGLASIKNTTSSQPSMSNQKPRRERLSSSGHDVLKRSIKDLQRSSVSLARFEVLLEAECEKSSKAITKAFENLRECLKKREELLTTQMTEFKNESVSLLKLRLENAAALKLKTDRAGGMSEDDVAHLRTEIKNFVAERKFDEELAETTRFVRDEDKMLEEIKTFGEVVPIKNRYKPVKLNPVVSGKKANEKSHDAGHNINVIGHHSPGSSGVHNKEHPHSGHYKGHHHEESGHHKEPSNHNRDHHRQRPGDHNKRQSQHHEVRESKANSFHQAKVTVASEKPVASSESLQEMAEMHAKLQAAVKQQVLDVQSEVKKQGERSHQRSVKKEEQVRGNPRSSPNSTRPHSHTHAQQSQPREDHRETTLQGKQQENRRVNQDQKTAGPVKAGTDERNQTHPQRQRNRRRREKRHEGEKTNQQDSYREKESAGVKSNKQTDSSILPSSEGEKNTALESEGVSEQNGVSSATDGLPQRRSGSGRRRNRGRDRRAPFDVKAEDGQSGSMQGVNGATDHLKENEGTLVKSNGDLSKPLDDSLKKKTSPVVTKSHSSVKIPANSRHYQDNAANKVSHRQVATVNGGGEVEKHEPNKQFPCSKEPVPPQLNGFISMNGVSEVVEVER